MGDRFGLQKLFAKASQDKIDLGDKGKFKTVVGEAVEIEDKLEALESSVRKLAAAMKRGNEPDANDYIKSRKEVIADSAKLDKLVEELQKIVDAAGKKAKSEKDAKAAKLLVDLDKQLDKLADLLDENRKLPHANEILLGLASGGFKAPSATDKNKDTPIKRGVKVGEKTPGSDFFSEVQWTAKAVPDVDLKSLTKLEKSIRSLDAVADTAARLDRDFAPLEAFLKKPNDAPDKKLAATAEELTKLCRSAAEANDETSKIEAALKKVHAGTDREKDAVEALRNNWKETSSVVTSAWKQIADHAQKGSWPNERYNAALADAKARAKAKEKEKAAAANPR